MSAKSDFINRLKYLDVALNSQAAIDIGMGVSPHNGAANLIRKGLGIVAFNILEDFIKAKSSEALDALSNSGVSYSNLPVKLQEGTTLGALKALVFRAKIKKKESGDWMGMIQSETQKIYSTSTAQFMLSQYSFASENSNVSADEVIEVLKAFNVLNGWAKLKDVSDGIFGGVTDLKAAYQNAAERRHNSAHTTDFEYQYSWLSNIKSELIAIAASFDILLTAVCRMVRTNNTVRLDSHNLTTALNYRFLVCDAMANKYKEKLSITSKSIKNWVDVPTAVAHLQPRLEPKNEFLIIIDDSSRIADWYS